MSPACQATSKRVSPVVARCLGRCILSLDNHNLPAADIMGDKKSKLPEPKTDATYGQRSAFPGLDHPGHASDDDDLEFEVETDALAYLQSVR